MHFTNLPTLTPQNIADLSLIMYKYKDFVVARYKTRRDSIWQSVRSSLFPRKRWIPRYKIQDIGIHFIDDDNIPVLSHAGHNIRLSVDWEVVNEMEVCVFHTGIASIINKVIPLYRTDGAYACEWENVPLLLAKFSKDIRELYFPPQHRISPKLFSEFLNTIHNNINSKCYKNPYYNGDDKYGVFSWSSIYKYVEWDFEMVEKYKNQIDWVTFIEYNSNLIWEERHFEQFHDYLLKYIKWDDVCAPKCFSSIVPFSFLWKYKEYINFEEVLGNTNLLLTIEELQLLFNYLKDKELTNGAFLNREMNKRENYITTYYSTILGNENFIWTEETLKCCSEQEFKYYLWKKDDTKYSTAVNTRGIIDNLLNINDYFADTQQRNVAYNFYEQYDKNHLPILTEDIITTNIEKWDKREGIKFTGTTYGSDIWKNYHEVTGWESSVCQKYDLTYSACKKLSQIEARIGGRMLIDKEEDPGECIHLFEGDFHCNALLYCSQNEIANQDELNKIVLDNHILEHFLIMNNKLVVDYAIELFFANYSIDRFMETKICVSSCKFKDDDKKKAIDALSWARVNVDY